MILSWDEVKEMNGEGVTLGAHSMTHPILTKVSPEQAKSEILDSKKNIEEKVNQPVTAFCYPGGKFDRNMISPLEEGGFRCALTGISRIATLESNPYELERIVGGWTFDVFKAFLFGFYPDLQALASRITRVRKNNR